MIKKLKYTLQSLTFAAIVFGIQFLVGTISKVSEFLNAFEFKSGVPAWVLNICISVIIGLLYYIFQVISSKVTVSTLNQKIWEKFYPEVSEIRIFGSGTETYRNSLRDFLKTRDKANSVEIKILMRDDDTPNRRVKIVEAVDKWKQDIEIISSITNVTTSVKIYKGSLMLRGVIFGDRAAILGWYYRIAGKNDSEVPCFVVENTDEIKKAY